MEEQEYTCTRCGARYYEYRKSGLCFPCYRKQERISRQNEEYNEKLLLSNLKEGMGDGLELG